MSEDIVSIKKALFRDPRYWDLKPTQARALPVLVETMDEYGVGGELDLSRKAICKHIGLRAGLYVDLLAKMEKWGWGCETGEGHLVLCGPLAPVRTATAIALATGSDLQAMQKMIETAVAAAMATARAAIIEEARPGIIEEARPEIIREYHRDQKRNRSAQGTEVSGKVESGFPENSADLPENEDGEEPDFPESEEGQRNVRNVDERDSKSYSSNVTDVRSYDAPTPPAEMDPPKVCEADVIQMLVERSFNDQGQNNIPEDDARALVKEYGQERCLQALLMLAGARTKRRRPAGFLIDVITDHEKYTIPQKIVDDAKRQLSPSVRKPAPRAAAPPRAKPAPAVVDETPVSERARIELAITVYEGCMDPQESASVDAEALERMTEPHQSEMRTMRQGGREASASARGEFRSVRSVVVRERALKGSDGPPASQGGAS